MSGLDNASGLITTAAGLIVLGEGVKLVRDATKKYSSRPSKRQPQKRNKKMSHNKPRSSKINIKIPRFM